MGYFIVFCGRAAGTDLVLEAEDRAIVVCTVLRTPADTLFSLFLSSGFALAQVIQAFAAY